MVAADVFVQVGVEACIRTSPSASVAVANHVALMLPVRRLVLFVLAIYFPVHFFVDLSDVAHLQDLSYRTET